MQIVSALGEKRTQDPVYSGKVETTTTTWINKSISRLSFDFN